MVMSLYNHVLLAQLINLSMHLSTSKPVGLGLAEEMLLTLAVCERASVAGGEEGRLLIVFQGPGS